MPRGVPKRLTVCESVESPFTKAFGKCVSCQTDCRRDTIFGTETIFGDVSLGSLFDVSPPRILARCPETGSKLSCQRPAKAASKSNCGCGAGDSPILHGQPEEPDSGHNPFRDDAVELPPLRPLPRVSEQTSAARQNPANRAPANLRVVRAKPVSSYSATATHEVERIKFADWLPNPLVILD